MPRQGAAAGRYRMADQGQPTQRGIQGMYVLKDTSGCQVYRPTWSGTRTIFRPFPAKDPENPEAWDPFRLSDEDRDWGDWIRRYDMAFGFGLPGITFITKDPFDVNIDDQQNPVWMLYRSIHQAVKAGTGDPSWNPLIFGAAGRGAPLSPPKDGYVMQGLLMEQKSIPQDPPRGCLMEHSPVVLLMSQSAGTALLDKLSEKTPEGTWRWPDITSLDGGMFVQFAQAGTQHNQRVGQPAREMGQRGVGGVAENNRYEVEFLELYNGIAPSYQGIKEIAAAHTKPWDKIVRIPTIEEQVKLVCNAGIPPSALIYALGDVYREYIPSHIWDQVRATRTPQSTAKPAWQSAAANPMMQAAATQHATPTQQPAATNPMSHATPMQQPVATNPMSQAAPAADPVAQGFDPQPQHAAPSRASDTMDAIARARARAAAAQGN